MSKDSSANNNKRIAKNTLLLYFRMLFMMAVSLFTSRVILNTLGVEDYGIYNVVGGVVAMFGFINGSMSSATQRYITFALGNGDEKRLHTVFSTTLQIHTLIAAIIVMLGETIGLWFLYNKMQIPIDRMDAAFWVLQFSIISTVIMIISVPYNAAIIAHEKMSAFAYISVLEVVLKLAIVYMLVVFSVDKLILYAFLILAIQVLIRFCYSFYCHKHFKETKYIHVWDKALFKEMTGFAGWSLWGNVSGILSTQGVNMLLNIFFGPAVNAARAVAVQVQNAIQQFVTNFQMALNPQLIKSYAGGDMKQHFQLLMSSAKYSSMLLMILAVPVIVETKQIVSLWLNLVPDYTIQFIRIILIISIWDSTANSCIISAQATGKVKIYQVVVGGIILLIVPLSYFLLILSKNPIIVFFVHLAIAVVAQIARLLFLRSYVRLSIRVFIRKVYVPLFVIFCIIVLVPYYLASLFDASIYRMIFIVIFSLIFSTLIVYLLGMNKTEKQLVSKAIVKLKNKVQI